MDQTQTDTTTNTTTTSSSNGTPNNNMPKYLLAGGALVLVLAGLFMYTKMSPSTNTPGQDVLSSQNQNTEEATPEVKEITINVKNFEYMPTQIKVSKGDTVRIILNNTDGFHDWVLDEFSAATKQLNTGESDTIEFVADKTGEFEYYCSIGSHRDMGMVGKLIVE